MRKHHVKTGVVGIGVGALLPLAAVLPAQAADITIHPEDYVSAASDTRATGHWDIQRNRVHIWTQGADGTDKAAEYWSADNVTLAAVAAAEEPTFDWSFKDLTITGQPGMQLGIDKDNNGTWDCYIVGEPDFYGDNWWSSNPNCAGMGDLGGTGYSASGSLDEWSAFYPDARVLLYGMSLGSGVHGDGYLWSVSINGDTYYFDDVNPTPEPTVVSATDKAYDQTTTGCRTASVHVGVAPLEADEAADPSDSTVRIRVGIDGSPVFGPTNLTYGQSYDHDFTFSQRWKASVIRVYFDRQLENIYKVERNCSMTSTLLTTIRGGQPLT
jgi:hypothetical protein